MVSLRLSGTIGVAIALQVSQCLSEKSPSSIPGLFSSTSFLYSLQMMGIYYHQEIYPDARNLLKYFSLPPGLPE